MNNKTQFRPVYGTEQKIIDAEYAEGHLYVAADSGKIFIDADGSRKQVGGSGSGGSGTTGIFWASASEEAGTLIKGPDAEDGTETPVYYIKVAAIDGDIIPDDNALIINADGRFFKVTDNSLSEDKTITVDLIAVSGSGGGGTVTVEDTRLLRTDSWKQNQTFIYNQDFYIQIGAESDVDDYIDLGFLVTQNGTQVESFSVSIENGSYYSFNTKRLPKGSGISIQVEADSINSKMTRKPKQIINNLTTVELIVNEDPNFKTSTIASGELSLSFQTKSNGLSQRLHVLIDDEELDLSADSRNAKLLDITQTGTQTVILPVQEHGVHNVDLFVTTVISEKTLASDQLSYELAWNDGESETPILWLDEINPYVINYDEAIIPFMVYNPVAEKNSEKTSVYLYYNDVEIPTSPMEVQYDANNWIKWDVTNLYQAEKGQPGKLNRFRIVCGGASRTVNIYVTTDNSRDMGLVNENALILNLNSIGRSNSETTTSRTNWSSNGFAMEFNDFNWYNNGWKNDEDGNGSYLSVANGAHARINLGDLQLNSSADYSFELRFRVRNIQEYSTLVRTIPYYKVLENDDSWPVATIKENGWTIKTDDDGNLVMDEAASIKEISQTAGVVVKYLNNAGYGLCIGTQEAYFNTPGSVVNVRYKEDEIINISFVVSKSNHLLSIYLNGILSGALDLASVSSFSMTQDNYFEFSSEFCDIDIFKIRVYRAELSMPDVIHNYISDLHDINLYDQNQLTADSDGTLMLYSKLLEYNKANPDKLSMPYAVWEIIDNGFDAAGNPIVDPNKGSHGADDDKLPVFKGNNRYCKITFVNPALDKALEDGTITEDFYYTHSPSYVAIGVDLNVQGTSSQAYPRRNFKTKMKSASSQQDGAKNVHEDWGWFYTKGSKAGQAFSKWNMDNEYCKTNKFTWKIDYMESSGSYNTGFANLVGNNMYDYHPLSRYDGFSSDGTGYRTSVYGFPVLVFHKHSTTADKAYDENDEYLAYEYIGRYNMNLDKSANEYYGFEIEGTHPFLTDKDVADAAECWELRDNQGTWTSFKYPDAAARSNGFGTTTSAGTLEVIKHFEYRYNSEEDALDEAYSDAIDATKTAVKGHGRTIDLSSLANKNTYLREKYSHLESLFNWLDSTDRSVVPATDTGTPLPQPVTYTTTVNYMVETFHEDGVDVAYYVDVEGNKLVKLTDVTETDAQNYYVYMVDGENIMTQAIAAENYTGVKRAKDDILITYNTDCADYRLKKFVNEFNDHLDLEYCLVYFILTELLLCYDSRGKNMMIASWGPQKAGGDYIWFPVFYDIDTQLGLNNIGAVLWDYDTDASASGTFSTANSVLWTNFFAGFRPAIEEKYRTLRRGSRLTESTIEGAYLCDPDVFKNSYSMRGVRPIIAIGLDEWYKYIAPGIVKSTWYTGTDRRFGFYPADGSAEKDSDSKYVYTCQGDRKLSRELFIRNRLNYLDSWWLAGAYDRTGSAYKTEIMIRANANDTKTSDTFLDRTKVSEDVAGYTRTDYPVAQLDAVPRFEITPFLAQYVTVFYDEDPITPTIKYDGINAVTTNTTPSVENGYRAIHPYNEQLTYIPGGDFLSDIGDISLKYPSHFKLSHAKRLIQLKLGNDHPTYFNSILGSQEGTFDLNDSATTSNKKGLLQKAIFTGLTNLKGVLDVGGSEKLRELRALKTQISSVVFAEGTPLDTIHLPKSLNELNLVYTKNLTRILTSKPEVMVLDENNNYVYNDPENYEGLYVEGLTDYQKTDTSSSSIVATINLQNVALGYDSYKLIENATDIKERFRANDYLALNLENVEWSPYKVIESDVDYTPSVQFYRLTDHNDFVPYVHTSAEEWGDLKLNGKLFTYNETGKEDYIQNLNLLKLYDDSYKAATGLNNNYYRNTRGSESITRPNITGVMFVNNTEDTPINEMDLQNVYKVAFPNLTIYAKYITHSYLAKFVQRLDSGKDEQIDLIRYAVQSGVHPTMTSKVPTRVNYDFKGWTLDPAYSVVSTADVDDLIANGTILTNNEAFAQLDFSTEKDAYVFYAVFAITSYKISYYNPDGTLIYEDTKPYGSVIGYELGSFPVFVNYSDNNLAANEHYYWLGWVAEQSDCFVTNEKMSKASDLTTVIAQNTDRQYYACYIKEDAKARAARDGFFTFETASRIYGDGWRIVPRVPMYGKVTLPVTYNDLPVLEIGYQAFRNMDVTSIYWNGDSQLKAIGMEAFYSCTALTYVEIPETLEAIGESAFRMDSALRSFYFPEGLISIGATAFNQCFTGAIELLTLPSTLTTLGNGAFSYCRWTYLNALDIGNETNGNSLRVIGNNRVFSANASAPIHTIRFYGGAHIDTSTLDLNEGCTIEEPGI